jgi:hypothetical protein
MTENLAAAAAAEVQHALPEQPEHRSAAPSLHYIAMPGCISESCKRAPASTTAQNTYLVHRSIEQTCKQLAAKVYGLQLLTHLDAVDNGVAQPPSSADDSRSPAADVVDPAPWPRFSLGSQLPLPLLRCAC